jgi:hypothetical protein
MKNLKKWRFFDRVTLSFAQMPFIWAQNSTFILQNCENKESLSTDVKPIKGDDGIMMGHLIISLFNCF